MRAIKHSVLLLTASMVLGAGLSIVTAAPAVAKAGPVSLHNGITSVAGTSVQAGADSPAH
jgi:hypothetical protein